MDRVARRYGRLPHEVEALEPYALTMAAICLEQADEREARGMRDIPGLTPVVVLGGVGGR